MARRSAPASTAADNGHAPLPAEVEPAGVETTHVLVVDAMDPITGLLLPFIAQRIKRFAEQSARETDPDLLARELVARTVAGDSDVRLYAFVKGGALVGHAAVYMAAHGSNRWAFLHQVEVDGDVGDAVRRGLAMNDAWARERGATKPTLMATTRDPHVLARAYGFEIDRTIMRRPVPAR